jgi:AcrR family transcriptional regulator
VARNVRNGRNAGTARARGSAADARREARQLPPVSPAAKPPADAKMPPEDGARSGGTPTQSRELRARGQRTLRKLLDAGVEVFEARGYHAARVDDVVNLAQTSHGTFYLYFANKEDLFRALMAEVADQMQALAEELGPLTPGAEGRAELHTWIGGFADLYERYGAVIRAWTEAEIGSHEFGRMGNDVLIRFTSVLTDRIAAVAPKDLDPVITALALVAMLERLNYYVLSRQVRITKPQMVETLARVTHSALFGN